jgi:predicted ATPase/DNA-binding CsgD family transcriptional regulator
VTVLATSREPLSVPGEVVWRVPSLPLPPVASADTPITAASLSQYDTVRLFVDRARRARPNFTVTDANAAAIAEVCHRLDGIALAIELAAARCRAISVERLATELDDRFRMLGGGARTVLPRQQTLLASVEWSYQLLDADERLVLRRLGVFAGDFDLDAAESVVPALGEIDTFAVLDVLTRLVDKSLVSADERDGEVGYRLLETIRQYAVARAQEHGELGGLRDAHLAWCAEWLGRFDDDRRTEAELAQIDQRYAEFRAAMLWAIANKRIDHGAAVATALCRPWASTGLLHDAAELGLPMLRLVESFTDHRSIGLAARLVGALSMGGHVDVVSDLMQTYLPLARSANDEVSELYMLVIASIHPGFRLEQRVTAFVLAERFRQLGYLGMFGFLETLGLNHVAVRGDNDQATLTRLQAALPGAASFDERHQRAFYNPAMIAMRRGQLSSASENVERLNESIRAPHTLGTVLALRNHLALLSGDTAILRASRNDIQMLQRTGVRTALPQLLLADIREACHTTGWADVTDFFEHVTGQSVLVPPWSFALCAMAGLESGYRWDSVMLNPIPLADSPAGEMARLQYNAAEAFVDGDVGRALGLYHDGIAYAHAREWKLYAVSALEGVGGCAGLLGHHIEGVRLRAAAQQARDEIGFVFRFAFEQSMIDDARATAIDALGEPAVAAAEAEGRALTWDAAVEYAQRSRGERGRPSHGWDSLTPTELQVTELAAQGKTNPQIAEALIMGRATVKTHLLHIFTKLNVATRAELAALAATRRTA